MNSMEYLETDYLADPALAEVFGIAEQEVSDHYKQWTSDNKEWILSYKHHEAALIPWRFFMNEIKKDPSFFYSMLDGEKSGGRSFYGVDYPLCNAREKDFIFFNYLLCLLKEKDTEMYLRYCPQSPAPDDDVYDDEFCG